MDPLVCQNELAQMDIQCEQTQSVPSSSKKTLGMSEHSEAEKSVKSILFSESEEPCI